MLYKIGSHSLVFSETEIKADGMIVRSADAGQTWQDVTHFETTMPLSQDASVIANAMGVVALQLAQYDLRVTQVKADVAALLASPAFIVDL
jgi:hypothetical protein